MLGTHLLRLKLALLLLLPLPKLLPLCQTAFRRSLGIRALCRLCFGKLLIDGAKGRVHALSCTPLTSRERPRPAAESGEVRGDGNGGGAGAHDACRRGEAVADRRDARRGACERGASRG